VLSGDPGRRCGNLQPSRNTLPCPTEIHRASACTDFSKKWNDPGIAAVNPGAALPARDIRVTYRRDGSGITYTFTDY